MPQATYDAHETHRMQVLDGRELASFGARAGAFAIDLAIAAVLFTLLTVPGGVLLIRAGVIHPQHDVMLHLNFFENWYSVVWLVLYFGLATYFGDGRTPGKRVMRIRVVSLVHDHLSLWHAVERALGYGASALEFGFGFLQYFVHPNRRTVHDRIAETIVVADRPARRGRASGVATGPSVATPLARETPTAPASQHPERSPPAV